MFCGKSSQPSGYIIQYTVMGRPKHDLAEVIEYFLTGLISRHTPTSYQLRVLSALEKCRTSALGGHKYRCDHCGLEHISYNSCRNRHCPQCQGSRQAFWQEDRIENAYQAKHYHLVFTIPEVLNKICLLDSKWFYTHLFACVWETLRSFGYSHYGVESGAVCILHTWGQNLSLHPHVHCIVPALGYTPRGALKRIGKSGRYLYPVKQLSLKFRGLFLSGIKEYLKEKHIYAKYSTLVEQAWSKPWVVFCEPSFGKPDQVVGYLSQYTHRVAISNQRILNVNQNNVRFRYKDYRDHGKEKTMTLCGEEFLRRFCLHILPKGFVKIRHYGIYSTRFRSTILKDRDKIVIKRIESTTERISRLLGYDIHLCQKCKKGRLVPMAMLPRIRSPSKTIIAATSTNYF